MIQMSKIALFSDLHIGVHQNSDLWLEIALNWSDWFAQSLKDNKIDTLFFLGDWYHYRDEINNKTLSTSNQILEKLKDFKMYMIPGNHDCYYKNNSIVNSIEILNGWGNIDVISERTCVDLNNKRFQFCPWGFDDTKIEHSDVLLGHMSIQNFKMNSFKVCDHGLQSNNLLKFCKCVFSGHFHKRATNKYDSKYITYLGNPFQTDFGDIGNNKGYYILDTSNLSSKFIENPQSPIHCKIFTSEIKSNDFFKDYFSKSNNFIIKLIVDTQIKMSTISDLLLHINSFKPINVIVDYMHKYSTDEFDGSKLKELNIQESIEEYISSVIPIEYKNSVSSKTIELFKKHS
jgi:DNA repair exonuclease SbcCD nuclease subunit